MSNQTGPSGHGMEPSGRGISNWAWVSRHRPFLALLGLAILVGLLLFRNYGLSWDEARNVANGQEALQAYAGGTDYFADAASLDHGPVYFMLFSTVGNLVHGIVPALPATDGRHLTNYVTFLIGLTCLYLISLRFLRPGMAWLVPALFLAQPLIFGYAFVNQKDIPFMTAFSAALVLGMSTGDRLARRVDDLGAIDGRTSRQRATGFLREMKQDFVKLGTSRLVAILSLTGIVLLVTFDLFVTGLIHRAAGAVLAAAYQGHAPYPIQWAFSHVATDAYKTPLDLYDQKLANAFVLIRNVVGSLVLLIGLIVASVLSPTFARAWGLGLAAWRDWGLWATGLAIGITICIRQVGVFTLGLVGLYMLFKLRTRAFFPMAVATLVAAATTVLTWPYLWGDPLGKFVADVVLASNFSVHRTWFMGLIYIAVHLPWTFFPVLAGIELTIPAVILIVLGLLLVIWRTFRLTGLPWASITVLILWFAVPLALLFSAEFNIYGNIRHLLFILPPLFVIGGLASEAILRRIGRPWIRAVLVAAALLPGIVAIIRLHPYEYIYYNALAGGPHGAYRHFEVDRWCLGTREAIEFLNQKAPQGASVITPSRVDQVAELARPDLELTNELTPFPQADYIIVCTYRANTPWHKDNYTNVFNVVRDDVNLTSVWKHE